MNNNIIRSLIQEIKIFIDSIIGDGKNENSDIINVNKTLYNCKFNSFVKI